MVLFSKLWRICFRTPPSNAPLAHSCSRRKGRHASERKTPSVCAPANTTKKNCGSNATNRSSGNQTTIGIAKNAMKSKWLCCIRIRIRRLDHPQKLLELPTQLAIFFHELAHLRQVAIISTHALKLCQASYPLCMREALWVLLNCILSWRSETSQVHESRDRIRTSSCKHFQICNKKRTFSPCESSNYSS